MKHKSFELKNKNGVIVTFSELGGRIISMEIPTKNEPVNIIVGAPNAEIYIEQDPYMGAICGRFANRIADAKFSLNGKTYNLSKNDGENHLHGGLNGFHAVNWNVSEIKINNSEQSYELTYESKDGEQGYPGNVNVSVHYTLTDENEFRIDFKAKTDSPTIINLTSHPYFNLKGCGSVTEHTLKLFADYYTPTDNTNIPTGEIRTVANSIFDFRVEKSISEIIENNEIVGLDNNFVLHPSDNKLRHAATVFHPETNRKLEILTTQNCLQVYTGIHFSEDMKGNDGKSLQHGDAIALEPQNFPDSPNNEKFNSSIVLPDETYEQTILYKITFA